MERETTDIYDPAYVADLFDRCASRYRRWSAIASFGLIHQWRKALVNRLNGQAALSRHKGADLNTRTPQIVDLMAGSGELWPHLLRVYPNATITAVDLSKGMQTQAMARLPDRHARRIRFLQADALGDDIPDASADMVVASFGLKTLTPEGQARLAHRIGRILRPGGTYALIEASDPVNWRLHRLYRVHIDVVLPLIERLVLRGARDFSMFGTYISNFRDCSHFAQALRDEGLFVSQRSHVFGCATSVAGFKVLAAQTPRP